MTSPRERLKQVANTTTEGFDKLLLKSIFLPIVTFFSMIAAVIEAGAQVLILPFEGVAQGAADLALAMFNAPATLLTGGAELSLQAVTDTAWEVFGPFIFPLMVLSLVAGWYIISEIREEEGTGNFIPLLPADVPVIGQAEEGEDQ